MNIEERKSINPGILSTVKRLQELGFTTVDSGDGETHDFDCDLPVPYVYISVDPKDLISETDRLLQALQASGIDFGDCPNPQVDLEGFEKYPRIESSYLPTQNRSAVILLHNVKLP